MKSLALAAAVLMASTTSMAQTQLSRSDARWVERTLGSLSPEEKVGQLLIPVIRGGFFNQESETFEKVRHNIVDLHAGGYHTFGGDPAAAALMLTEMQELAKVPLLITADLEGGAGFVLPGATRLPLAMAIGATGNEQYAYLAGKIAAEEGRAVGIHVNFYPVADVQMNPRNPIINIRSFGEDPERVSAMVRAYIRGAQEAGHIATAKHFPGHGDVATDSHLEMPVLDVSRERLDKIELPPFRAAIAEGVGAFMSAHIYMAQLESEKGLPATLSRAVLTDLLRKEMGFEGLVFTDALDMGGVTKGFSEAEATVRSFEAGADVILFPPNPDAAYNALVDAVRSGRISEQRLDASVRRILEAKAKMGLHRSRNVNLSRLNEIVGSKKNRDTSREISEAAITLVRDERNALPIKPSEELRLLHINLLDNRQGWREGPVGVAASEELLKRFPRVSTMNLDNESAFGEYQNAKKMADLADLIIVTAFIRTAAYKGSIDLTPLQLSLIKNLSERDKPFAFALFGSPYVLSHVPELPSYILAYDTHPAAEVAVIRAITGEIPFRGRLPVALPELYPIGFRLEK